MWSEASFGEAQSGAGENAAFIMAVGCSDGNSVLKVVVTIDKGKIQGEKNGCFFSMLNSSVSLHRNYK